MFIAFLFYSKFYSRCGKVKYCYLERRIDYLELAQLIIHVEENKIKPLSHRIQKYIPVSKHTKLKHDTHMTIN